jgi:hypothetical protein
MKSYKRAGRAAAVAALLLGTVAFSKQVAADESTDQSPSQETPQTLSATLVHVPATVTKIDKSKNEVMLKGPEGRTVDVKAGPGVNLEQLKVGDKATASYYDEVAVSMEKPASGAPKMTTKTVERAGVTATQTTLTAHIVKVDAPKDTVVIRGPQGEHALKVENPDLQARLKKAKPGDSVEISYTQAVALTIEPRKT